MTSVDQHVDDMIQTAVDLLMKQIHNEPITDKIDVYKRQDHHCPIDIYCSVSTVPGSD